MRKTGWPLLAGLLCAAPAAALERGDLVLSTPDALLRIDPSSGASDPLGEEDPDLRWGFAVVGSGGVLFVLETSEESGRVVELVPDDGTTRVVAEDAAFADADGIAVASGTDGAIVAFRVSCGIGFELALVLPALMALRRRAAMTRRR